MTYYRISILNYKYKFNYVYKFSLFIFFFFLDDYILKLNFFNILLKIIFFFLKKNYLNVFFLFNQNYYCFRFVNNKFFIIKYLKFFSWNILKNIDLILNINNYISNSNLIFKKNIPVIIFSKLRIFRNNYSFIYFINSKYFYIFFLLILQNLKLRKKK